MRALIAAVFILSLFVTVMYSSSFIHADGPFYWDYIEVDIDVQENGDLLITETQKYVFTGPHTNERYRWIPLNRVATIDNVQIFEDGTLLTSNTGIQDKAKASLERHNPFPKTLA